MKSRTIGIVAILCLSALVYISRWEFFENSANASNLPPENRIIALPDCGNPILVESVETNGIIFEVSSLAPFEKHLNAINDFYYVHVTREDSPSGGSYIHVDIYVNVRGTWVRCRVMECLNPNATKSTKFYIDSGWLLYK